MNNAIQCLRVGVQVEPHKLLTEALSRVVKHPFAAHTLEDGASFLEDRDLQLDIIVPAGKLQDALIPAYRRKGVS